MGGITNSNDASETVADKKDITISLILLSPNIFQIVYQLQRDFEYALSHGNIFGTSIIAISHYSSCGNFIWEEIARPVDSRLWMRKRTLRMTV